MKKFCVYFIVSISIFACSEEKIGVNKNDRTDVSVENGRISFKDSKAYFETISALNKMDERSLASWQSKYKINSLMKYFEENQMSDSELKHEDLINFPYGYTSVLNSDAEVKIGDALVWYNQGTKYFVSNGDESLLQALKLDPSLNSSQIVKLKYTIKKIEPKNEAYSSSRINYPANSGVGTNGYQFQFSYCLNGTQRKYINELYAIQDQVAGILGGYQYHTSLTLRMKLEYRTSKGAWRVAGENRNINYSVTESLRLISSGFSITSPLTGYYVNTISGNTTRNTDLLVTLYDIFPMVHYNGDPEPYYDVELTGYITQSILNGSTLCNPYTVPSSGSIIW